jgi:Rieske Fe-S protein
MGAGGPGRSVSRRAVVAATTAAWIVCGAGAIVSACGRSITRPDMSGPPVLPSAGPAPGDGRARAFARTGDIPLGGGRVFPDVRVVVTQPAAGEFKAFGIVCTHDGCELDGVSGGTINCPCHGSRFAITDGSVVQGPARSALRQETVAVHGGGIVLL